MKRINVQSPIGKVESVQDHGSSERGMSNGSGSMLAPYPHEDNGTEDSIPGPTNQTSQQHGGKTQTRGPDERPLSTHQHLEQIGVIS